MAGMDEKELEKLVKSTPASEQVYVTNFLLLELLRYVREKRL
jgi:hypothetical protein